MPHLVELRFPADHPTAAGHFPGNPIIPGALLLDVICHAIIGAAAGQQACAIRSVKFLRPVRPGDGIGLSWRIVGEETRFDATLRETEELAVTGTLRLGRSAG